MTTERIKSAGIHHITAFAGNAQANADFYAGVLAMRLVKKTVNFDAPDVYHFYFGDERGNPGTIMTFFPFEHGRRGRVGGGQVGYTTFVIPPGSLSFWEARLDKFGVKHERQQRFGETYVRFTDHEGLQLELVERAEGKDSAWSFAGVPADKAIKGFGGAVLYSTNPARTMALLENVFGLERVSEEAGHVRFRAFGDIGNVIDVVSEPVPRGSGGTGTVHHIAMRSANQAAQTDWLAQVSAAGYMPTPVQDRNYFTSIYFREEGEILFEIATDDPGFERDESFEQLGSSLKLPEWYEPHRAKIEQILPHFEIREPVPAGNQANEQGGRNR